MVTVRSRYSDDAERGVTELIKRYGAIEDGGIITHVVYDDMVFDKESFVKQVTGIASDPLVKAIVVNQAAPGTAEAFRKIRFSRPYIILLAGDPEERLDEIQTASDIVLSQDFISRGFIIPWVAQKMGAESFVHIASAHCMEREIYEMRTKIMEEACKDLNMPFYRYTAPDLDGQSEHTVAKKFIAENLPKWLQEHGENTAFFCADSAEIEPLLKVLLDEHAGIFVEADLPSPLVGYPRALLTNVASDDYRAVISKLRLSLENRVAGKRFSTWFYPHSTTVSLALGEYAKQVIAGNAKKGNLADLEGVIQSCMPNIRSRLTAYVDPKTGKRAANHMLIYTDTYVFGQGFIATTELAVPDKYRKMHF